MNSVVTGVIAFVFVIAIPVYFWIKFLQHKMNPRRSFKAFFLWLIVVVATSFGYYFLCMYLFFKFFSLKS